MNFQLNLTNYAKDRCLQQGCQKIKYCTVIDAHNIIQMYPKCVKMLNKEPSQSCIFNEKMHECIYPLVLWAAIGDTIIISDILLADNLVSPMDSLLH